MTDYVEFQDTRYTEEVLASLEVDTLLELRNNVAEEMGIAKIKSFKSAEQARAQTWKALEAFRDHQNAPQDAPKAKKAKAPSEPRVVKGAAPSTVKRPTRNMFRRIQKLGEPDRVRERWDNYKDGMTILQTIEGENMTPLDIYWYEKTGFVKLIDPTEEEYQAGVQAWCERNGVENPLTIKARRKEEREQEKVRRAEARALAKEAAKQANAEAAA